MKNTNVICVIVLGLAGCADGAGSDPVPNFFNGKYYMAGDTNCTSMRQIADARVMCYDAAGRQTFFRDALTSQQIQMWQYNQQLAQQRNAASVQSMRQAAASLQQSATSIQQSTPRYTSYPAPGSRLSVYQVRQ